MMSDLISPPIKMVSNAIFVKSDVINEYCLIIVGLIVVKKEKWKYGIFLHILFIFKFNVAIILSVHVL